jgi:hypothetical protein
MQMFAGRLAAGGIIALCSLSAPATALAQQQPAAAQPTVDTAGARRGNETLSKVIIYGSLGAIAGALGSLRVRRGPDAVADDEAAAR